MKRPRDTNQLAKANGLHGYALRGEEPRPLMRMVVFNEAHRVRNSRRLEVLAREECAFGIGIVIGIQFPGDLLEAMAGNLATQLFLKSGHSLKPPE
jgi:DNA helicase HerA-like ATPase